MLVLRIAYGFDNDKQSAPPKGQVFIINQPLNKPSLLKQVRILILYIRIYMGNHLGTVAEQLTVGRITWQN